MSHVVATMNSTTFSTFHVYGLAENSGTKITRKMLERWLAMKLLPAWKGKSPGKGTSRTFTFGHLVAFLVLERLHRARFPLKQAHRIVSYACSLTSDDEVNDVLLGYDGQFTAATGAGASKQFINAQLGMALVLPLAELKDEVVAQKMEWLAGNVAPPRRGRKPATPHARAASKPKRTAEDVRPKEKSRKDAKAMKKAVASAPLSKSVGVAAQQPNTARISRQSSQRDGRVSGKKNAHTSRREKRARSRRQTKDRRRLAHRRKRGAKARRAGARRAASADEPPPPRGVTETRHALVSDAVESSDQTASTAPCFGSAGTPERRDQFAALLRGSNHLRRPYGDRQPQAAAGDHGREQTRTLANPTRQTEPSSRANAVARDVPMLGHPSVPRAHELFWFFVHPN